jgi:hypothetical protein
VRLVVLDTNIIVSGGIRAENGTNASLDNLVDFFSNLKGR